VVCVDQVLGRMPPCSTSTHEQIEFLDEKEKIPEAGWIKVNDWHHKHRDAVTKFVGREKISELAQPDWVPLAVAAAVQGLGVVTAILYGRHVLPFWSMFPVAYVIGAWTFISRFNVLHDLCHASIQFRPWRKTLMRIFDLPSIGTMNYLYYTYFHREHHHHLGNGHLEGFFDSERDFDGDVLFNGIIMLVRRDTPFEEPGLPPFIFSKNLVVNAVVTTAVLSMLIALEPVLDLVNIFRGKYRQMNNRPRKFHEDMLLQCFISTASLATLWACSSWRAVFFLYLGQVLGKCTFHPAHAFWSSTHGTPEDEQGSSCQPTRSSYFGLPFDVLMFNLNYHTEHHDFPEIPSSRLKELHDLAKPLYINKNVKYVDSISTVLATIENLPIYGCQGKPTRVTSEMKKAA